MRQEDELSQVRLDEMQLEARRRWEEEQGEKEREMQEEAEEEEEEGERRPCSEAEDANENPTHVQRTSPEGCLTEGCVAFLPRVGSRPFLPFPLSHH